MGEVGTFFPFRIEVEEEKKSRKEARRNKTWKEGKKERKNTATTTLVYWQQLFHVERVRVRGRREK